MKKLREVLRNYHRNFSKSEISRISGISRTTVKKYIRKYQSSGLNHEDINRMTDLELSKVFGEVDKAVTNPRLKELEAFFPEADKMLRKKGYTRLDAFDIYREKHPKGFGKTQFHHYFKQWQKRTNPVMHINHKAAEKLYVDYAGTRLHVVDKETGEERSVEVFLATLGASQYTYIEATETQQKHDFIKSCENALHFFGGVPQVIVPDNLKSAVTKSDRYEPTINETFADFAEHYGTTVIPARAYKPKDKSLVEGAVKISYRRIYKQVKKQTYYTLDALNESLWSALDDYNSILFSNRDYSRKDLFEEIEKDELLPLPRLRYEFKKQALVTVMKNSHICLREDLHYYSVPHQFIGKKVKMIYTVEDVKVYYKYECVAVHKRNGRKYKYTTIDDHMASKHRFMSEWTPERFIQWSGSLSEEVQALIKLILDTRTHPEQAYKSCLGILNMEKKVGRTRLINACKRSLEFGNYSYGSVKTILEKGLDKLENEGEMENSVSPEHENIRGNNYYQ